MRASLAILLGSLTPIGLHAQSPTPFRAQIERDLAIEVRLPQVVEVGERFQPEINLINRSKRASYSVIKPGDGSGVGWREPHVYYSAEIDMGDGRWQPVPRKPIARCGLYASDWQKDIVELKPGEKLPLNTWVPTPDMTLDLLQPGKMRLYVHYAYSGGKADKTRKEELALIDVGTMKGVPAFELISAPVEFELTRPLELMIEAKAPLRLGKTKYLSEVLTIHLANRSDEPRTILIRLPNALTVQFDGAHAGWEQIHHAHEDRPTKTILKPGQVINLIGEDGLVFGLDWTWKQGDHVEPLLKVRAARLGFTVDDSPRLLTSNSAEIQVKK